MNRLQKVPVLFVRNAQDSRRNFKSVMDGQVRIAARPSSVWGLVGNIVPERPYGPGACETRSGTRLFRANAKVYLCSLRHAFALEPDEDAFNLSVNVIGQHRKLRKWIRSWVRISHTHNWRIQRVYKPQLILRLWESDWAGFALAEEEFRYNQERGSANAVARFLHAVNTKRCD